MSPLLDLSDADLKGFEPLPSAAYVAEVFEVKMQETKGGEGAKLPAGTPRINIQFRILGKVGDDDIGSEDNAAYNRRAFWGLTIPPAKGIDGKPYDKTKAAKMKGMIVRTFTALGYEEDSVVSAEFDPDFEDMVGRRAIITLGIKDKWNGAPGEKENETKGVKVYNDAAGAGGNLL